MAEKERLDEALYPPILRFLGFALLQPNPVKRGKAKKLALVAAARKILTWAWTVFRSNTPFDPVKAGAKSV